MVKAFDILSGIKMDDSKFSEQNVTSLPGLGYRSSNRCQDDPLVPPRSSYLSVFV